MERTLHAFDFLAAPPAEIPHICVASGDDFFLQRLTMRKLTELLQSSDDGELSISSFDGDDVAWCDVADELATASLFGSATRFVRLRSADDFVSKHRTRLEDYVASPCPTSTLLLEVKAWPGTTRLAKQVAQTGLAVICKAPERKAGKSSAVDTKALSAWIQQWARKQHGLTLQAVAVEQLVDLVGEELGLIDQELIKLSLTVNDPQKVSIDDVIQIVGGWRVRSTRDLLDAACSGQAADALQQLDRILTSGEHALALFGAFSWSLRRFASATRIIEQQEHRGQRPKLHEALAAAGFRSYPQGAMQTAESQLKQIGRERGGQIYHWLLETDLQLKGTHSTPDRARFVMEMLILKLASQAKPARVRT